MGSFVTASKTIVIRTSRDTLGLLVAATAMTFALSNAVHSKHETQAPKPEAQAQAQASGPAVAQDSSPQQDWAGRLADLTPSAAPTPAEPMTSASLTVPKSQLALPAVPKPGAKPRPCVEPQGCAAKVIAASATPHHQTAAGERPQKHDSKSMIGMLNPLNHLPDMSAMGRPFSYAGGAVAGWFKRL